MALSEELRRSDCFLLEIDGVSTAGFSACRGLGERRDVLEFREGGYGGIRRFRGRSRGGRLVLERGLTSNRLIRDWFERGDPRSGAVVFLSADRQANERWSFDGAWPVSWSASDLDANEPGIALERVEIVFEGMRWEAS